MRLLAENPCSFFFLTFGNLYFDLGSQRFWCKEIYQLEPQTPVLAGGWQAK